jgi:hypothetical protein
MYGAEGLLVELYGSRQTLARSASDGAVLCES